jgi:hypothetical protein
VYHAAVHVTTTVWHETVHVAKAADTFVHHHAAAITSIAAGAAVFVGCEALTAGVGTVGCAAAAGAVGNLVSYGMSCGSAAGGCSVTGALLSAGSGVLAGAVGGALIGPLGGELSSSVLGDVLPDIAIRGLAGATAGAGAGAVGGASGYAGNCLQGASCSLSGLGKSAMGGAETGAILGGVGGALDPGLTRAACGGESFSARTKVLTASGAVVAISKLSKGQKVVATSTKTGKTSAETIAAVMVHHDTNLYDLKVRTGHRTAVIQTTSNHLFWDATARRWVKAAALKYGHYLRTPSGGRATAVGGFTPRARSGWMWDLTVTTDHDFYIQAAATAVLVHNINSCGPNVGSYRAGLESRPAAGAGAARDYQVANVGPTEYRIVGGGTRVWADSVDVNTGEAVEAKYVGDASRSPYVPESDLPDSVRTRILQDQQDEFSRYARVIGDSGNPLTGLHVITNSASAGGYFGGLMSRFGIVGRITVTG